MKLSDKLRPNVECAPWVIEEIKKLENENDKLYVIGWNSGIEMVTTRMDTYFRRHLERDTLASIVCWIKGHKK